jgi:hypothetical protein
MSNFAYEPLNQLTRDATGPTTIARRTSHAGDVRA